MVLGGFMIKVCETGHRPKNLPWGYNEKSSECKKFKHNLTKLLKQLIKEGCTYFVSGMAMGVDMIFAETILKLKEKNDLTLEAAIPCENQTKGWTAEYIERYNKILSKADVVTYVSKKYTNDCMMKRNKYMVDGCDYVVAVCKEGLHGGTKNTIEYAKKSNKKIYFINL